MAEIDVMNAKRYQIQQDGENWYISIVGEDNSPWEIWISVPDENKKTSQRARSNGQSVAALAQELLQEGVDPYRVVAVIQGATTTNKCEAAMIAAQIFRYLEGE